MLQRKTGLDRSLPLVVYSTPPKKKERLPLPFSKKKRVLSIWVFAIFAMRKRVDDGLLVSWFLKV
jgi:hypothetical protein